MKHIIWDWNGTLFDDAWLCVEILNRLLTRRGLPTTDIEHYQNEFMFPVETYYRHLGFDLDREPFEHLAVEYMEHYDRRRVECRLQPGVNKVLTALAVGGYSHSILSATEQSRLEAMVRFADLHHYFTNLAGISDCYARSKTYRGQQLLAHLDCDPARIVMIGDTPHDHEVAEELGIACILIPSGHCSRARLAACGVKIADNMSDLLSLIDSPN
jgi:phosphoglycolate phosphatase